MMIKASRSWSGQLYQQLIDKDKVDLVFSPYGTPLTLAASEVTEGHKYVMLAAGASGEAIWSRGYKYIFGIYAPAKRYFIGFLDLIARHGLTSVAIVAENTSFNLSCAQGVREWAPRFGLQVTLNRVYQKGEEFPANYSGDRRTAPRQRHFVLLSRRRLPVPAGVGQGLPSPPNPVFGHHAFLP
jgi:ABC-type branched-subunit amino acid transport system substrate-binding protein